jgi:hypothetical protein
MPRFWNRLPGPSAFVAGIVHDLRQGLNVAVLIPEGVESDFVEEIKKEVQDIGFSWTNLSADQLDPTISPVDQLFDRFVPDAPVGLRRNALALVQQENFESRIICLYGFDESEHWAPWEIFINEYQVACGSQDPILRTLFIIILSGDIALNPPCEDTQLAHHRWQGCVDSFDMLLYAADLLAKRHLSILSRHLTVNLCAQLALWDREVCRRLTGESFGDILQPHKTLKDIAQERAWCDPNVDVEKDGWRKGMVQMFDGKKQIHSAFLAGKERYSELNRRMWSAQVKVLFPYIEEQRMQLLHRYGDRLRIPYVTARNEMVTELLDLEISHIDSQFRERSFSIDENDRKLARLLKDIRNSLAHQEVVELNTLREIEDIEDGWQENRVTSVGY